MGFDYIIKANAKASKIVNQGLAFQTCLDFFYLGSRSFQLCQHLNKIMFKPFQASANKDQNSINQWIYIV